MAVGLGVRPLTPSIGAEIAGVDLASDLHHLEVVDAVRKAFLDHHVLVFRDQTLDREAHKAFGRLFGELHIHPSRRDPGFKGDTSGNTTKPATVNTGLVVQVPLFVNIGDKLKIDTRTSSYVERA